MIALNVLHSWDRVMDALHKHFPKHVASFRTLADGSAIISLDNEAAHQHLRIAYAAGFVSRSSKQVQERVVADFYAAMRG